METGFFLTKSGLKRACSEVFTWKSEGLKKKVDLKEGGSGFFTWKSEFLFYFKVILKEGLFRGFSHGNQRV